MTTHSDRIVIDARILAGKPVVRGTRLAVEFILDLLSQGWSERELPSRCGRVAAVCRARLAVGSHGGHSQGNVANRRRSRSLQGRGRIE